MIFDQKTINKLISSNFEIDCVDILLTQKIDEDPIMYSGPGTIWQDTNGILRLKLYTKINDLRKEMEHRFKHHTPGKIIPEEDYFTLKAIDMGGNEWTSDNILVSGDVSFPSSGRIIKSSLKNIETIGQGSTTEKNYLFILISGNIKIPCNEKEDLPNGGWRLNRSVFSANNLDFDLNLHEDFSVINVNSKVEFLNADTSFIVLEALSVITGLLFHPVVVKYTLQDLSVLRINSVSSSESNRKFPPPLQNSSVGDIQPVASFLEKYLIAIERPYSELFGFWHKANRAWQADIRNASLSLGVSIEGILKYYFREYGLPDTEIAKQAEEAKKELNKVKIGGRIKGRLFGSINGLLNNPSPKSALYKLFEEGIISKAMVDEWVKLRNKSVHPDKFNEDPLAFQKYVDRFYTCIALLYRLFFKILKYEESYIDYSENGWPEKNIKA